MCFIYLFRSFPSIDCFRPSDAFTRFLLSTRPHFSIPLLLLFVLLFTFYRLYFRIRPSVELSECYAWWKWLAFYIFWSHPRFDSPWCWSSWFLVLAKRWLRSRVRIPGVALLQCSLLDALVVCAVVQPLAKAKTSKIFLELRAQMPAELLA